MINLENSEVIPKSPNVMLQTTPGDDAFGNRDALSEAPQPKIISINDIEVIESFLRTRERQTESNASFQATTNGQKGFIFLDGSGEAAIKIGNKFFGLRTKNGSVFLTPESTYLLQAIISALKKNAAEVKQNVVDETEKLPPPTPVKKLSLEEIREQTQREELIRDVSQAIVAATNSLHRVHTVDLKPSDIIGISAWSDLVSAAQRIQETNNNLLKRNSDTQQLEFDFKSKH